MLTIDILTMWHACDMLLTPPRNRLTGSKDLGESPSFSNFIKDVWLVLRHKVYSISILGYSAYTGADGVIALNTGLIKQA